MQLKKLTTKKLFYNKYPYKLGGRIRGAWHLHSDNVKEDYRKGKKEIYGIDTNDFNRFLTVIEPYYGKVKMRVEYDLFNLYLDNAAQFEQLKTALKPWLYVTYEPATTQELEYLLQHETCKKTVCNHLPYHRYQYRVNLCYAIKEDIKENFIGWAENYGEKIRIPPKAKKWFNGFRQWPWTPYIYVEDKHILIMALMFLGNAVLSTEEYITKDQLNTIL